MEDINDPFPLFHLSNLNFLVESDKISTLSSSNLALASFSSDWDESLSKKVIKAWRQRREKYRKEIGIKIGRFANEIERNKSNDRWVRFELIDLSWILSEKTLGQLNSAQLAVSQIVNFNNYA